MRREDKQVKINNYQILTLVSCGAARLSPLGTLATIWHVLPAPDDG
jgi:hypothetical protein